MKTEFTYNELLEQISKMTPEQRDQQVVFVENDEWSHPIKGLGFTEYDYYVNINDDEEIGTLEELKENYGDDFNEDDFKLLTPAGTPYLHDQG